MNNKQKRNFWKKVDKTDSCWNWLACKDKLGYGQFWFNGKTILAYRASWMINKGQIPKNLCVLHKCDNPPCVNPNHLFLGTRQDNMRDMMNKGRGADKRGEKHHLVKLTENKVDAIRKMYAAGNITQIILGRLFSVDQSQISHIINRVNWNHI